MTVRVIAAKAGGGCHPCVVLRCVERWSECALPAVTWIIGEACRFVNLAFEFEPVGGSVVMCRGEASDPLVEGGYAPVHRPAEEGPQVTFEARGSCGGVCLVAMMVLWWVRGCRKRSERRLRNRRMHAFNGNPEDDEADSLTLGSWNLSVWTRQKAEEIAGWGCDVVALQETRLARVQLERERTACAGLRLRLHHGQPAEQDRGGYMRGVSCGVGFLAGEGVGLKAIMPRTPAWTRLYASRRLHVVSILPSKGFPRGLWMVSLYAPLEGDRKQREVFDAALWETVTGWDMNIPIVVMGDFNGVMDGDGKRQCGLLTRLIGPGGPFTDAHEVAGAADEVRWTFATSAESREGGGGRTRIDRILVNRMCSELVLQAGAQWRECGHRPLWVRLKGHVDKVDWFAKQLRRPPEVLRLNSQELAADERWNRALDALVMDREWDGTVERMCTGDDVEEVSAAISCVAERVIELCGGWEHPVCTGKAAYSTPELRVNRKQQGALRSLLGHLEDELRGRGGELPVGTGERGRTRGGRGAAVVQTVGAGCWGTQTAASVRAAEKALGRGLGPDGRSVAEDGLTDLQGLHERASGLLG